MDSAHLASYLNEFVFRFNRRTSRSRGMLFYRVMELAVGHEPVRYHELLKSRRPGTGTDSLPVVNGTLAPNAEEKVYLTLTRLRKRYT